MANPASPSQMIGYMVSFYQQLLPGATGCPATYTNTRGRFTVGACVKLILRGDNYWHDILESSAGCPVATASAACIEAHQVTASDVKYSILSFNATGGPYSSPGTLSVIDATYNPNQLPGVAYGQSGGANTEDSGETLTILLHANNAWALNDLTTFPIIPQHIWSCQGNETAPSACQNVHKQANGLLQPCVTIGTPACTADPARLTADPVSSYLFVGSGPWVCANADLSSGSGLRIGGGCTSSGSQAIPFGGSAVLRRYSADQGRTAAGTNYGTNPHFAYFRSSSKFQQFEWANYFGTTVTSADRISATQACYTSATGVGGVKSYPACQHWNSTSAGVGPSIGPAGTPALGISAGDAGTIKSCTATSCQGETSPITQINQWIGRSAGGTGNAFTFGASTYTALSGAQPIPATLYDDGNSEGTFFAAVAPATVHATNSTAGSATVSVTLSGGPDNNFTGPVTVTLSAVQSAGLSVSFGTTTLSLSPTSPTASTSVTIPVAVKNGTYTVYIKASSPGFPIATATITVVVP
jgi:hypothetical protein